MADVAKTVGILFKAQDQASGVADKLASEMKTLGTSSEAASASSAKLGTQQGILVEQLRKMQTDTARVQSETAKLTGNTELLGRATKLLGTEFDYAGTKEEALLLKHGKLAAESDLAKAKTQQLAEQTKGLGDNADKSAGQSDRFVTALKAIATAAVLREFVEANSQLEKLTLGFTSITGTSEGAAREMDYVRDASERLGIKLNDAGGAYLKLAAATKGTVLEGEGARTIFEAVAKQLALLGGSSADVSGALVQVSQGISKGKFELEDLKSIAERIPGFFDKFAQSLGKTTPELFKLIEQGKIGGPEFLKFAQTINSAIGGIDVDTFEAKAARAQNAWDRFLVSVGKAGAYEVAKQGLDATGFAVEKAGAAVQTFSGIFGELLVAAKNGDFTGVWDRISAAINKAGASGLEYEAKLFGINLAGAKVNETTAETARLARQAADALGGNETDAETQRLLRQASAQQDAINKTGEALKTLGVDTKKVNADLIGAFETVAASATASGKDIFAGFNAALKSADTIDDINKLGAALTKAYLEGRISAEEFGKATVLLGERQQKLLDPTGKVAAELKKQSEQADTARESAEKLALEYEKLASNERIKTLEFKAEIDVARIQADAQKVIAAFDSINTSITSTGDVLGNLFGLFESLDRLDSSARNALFAQIDKENSLRERAFELQKELTQAQIANMKAQTRSLESGDALIKIDGAGLQPQLEAFMWEILKTIQTRVNRDGLGLLLGV